MMTESDSNPKSDSDKTKRCCEGLRFEDVNEGKGYNSVRGAKRDENSVSIKFPKDKKTFRLFLT